METETANAITLALLDCVDEDGDESAFVSSLLARLPDLDPSSLVTVCTALTVALAYKSHMSPRASLRNLLESAPSDVDWVGIAAAIERRNL